MLLSWSDVLCCLQSVKVCLLVCLSLSLPLFSFFPLLTFSFSLLFSPFRTVSCQPLLSLLFCSFPGLYIRRFFVQCEPVLLRFSTSRTAADKSVPVNLPSLWSSWCSSHMPAKERGLTDPNIDDTLVLDYQHREL